jgi:SAM-dependent methyltransferase
VGHANSMECHKAMLRSLPTPRDLTGIDIAEPAYDTSAYYSRSVRASIDATPFSDGSFDLIWCISSLEHIGMDNSQYVQAGAAGKATPEAALSEMIRLLRPGGSLLITVPYGRYEDHGWFRNFDEKHLQALLAPIRPRMMIRESYYDHTPKSGWRAADPASLRAVGYGDQDNAGAAGLAAVLITNRSAA